MWAESYTKLLAFNLTQYSRVIALDSDATLLKPMDELFILPSVPAAMPRAYWLDTPMLASHIMLITPSAAEFERIQALTKKAGLGMSDMEIVNQLFGKTCMVLPHRKYALLTGEFRREEKGHRGFLEDSPSTRKSKQTNKASKNSEASPVNTKDEWNPETAYQEASLIHFSDHPMPKPWEWIGVKDVLDNRPKCVRNAGEAEGIGGEKSCWDREVWARAYKEFRERREVCFVLFFAFFVPSFYPMKLMTVYFGGLLCWNIRGTNKN
jgi:alpha-N-acetylglucosamine transferase